MKQQPSPTPVYRSRKIREIELRTANQPEPPYLMGKAGLAVAEVARDRLSAMNASSVLILAGPGNNGGDALVCARHLKQWWFKVALVFTGKPDKLSGDAAKALRDWLGAGGTLLPKIPGDGKWDLVIDGLFGIGLERDLEASYLQLVNQINEWRLPVLAIDIPSGLCSDTGRVRGAAVRASATVTFIGLKPGLLTHHGSEYCGEIVLRHLDLDAPSLLAPDIWVIDRDMAASALQPRPAGSHKGLFGNVAILGGAKGMAGAPLLAGRAALKMGAGRVYLGLFAQDAPGVDPQQPELMLRSPEALLKLDHVDCLVAGPGMGESPDAFSFLKSALESKSTLVLDADALNLIAAHSGLQRLLSERSSATILTPHPAEAARLLGAETRQIQNDRLAAAGELAKRFNSHAVLKGAGSICATLDGKCYINTTGNPGLSSAGMGDVLSGMIAAFVAQRLTPEQALLLGVYLHGAAADELVRRGTGPVGLTATEVTDAARDLLNQWVYGGAKNNPAATS